MHTSRGRGAPVSSFLPLLAAAILVAVIWLAVLPSTADAQCGTQMSSCRNCHEVKGQLKVNTKGDWHVNHAFGDFCVTCHGGDAKVKDAAPAHAGMVKPLENITAACASCHPADLKTRADRYAKTLGVTAQLGAGAATAPAGASPAAPPVSQPVTSSVVSVGGGCGPIGGVAVGGLVDFNLPLDSAPGVNLGNIIVAGLILVMGAAWAGIVLAQWLGAARRRMADAAAKRPATALRPAVGALVPALSACDDETLNALASLLNRPEAGSQAIQTLSRLRPELLELARRADPSALAMAVALARKP
jgi:hypothetical protein